MSEVRLLLLFLMFYVQNSSSAVLETPSIVAIVRTIIRQMNKIDTIYHYNESFVKLIHTDSNGPSVWENLKRLNRDLVNNRDLFIGCSDFDQILFALDFSKNLHSSHEFYIDTQILECAKIIERHWNRTRRKNDEKLTALTGEAINARNGGCIGPTAFDEMNQFYLRMIKLEAYGYFILAAARAIQCSKNCVIQPNMPDYSNELKNQYVNYTEKFISLLKRIKPFFSADCNGETTIPPQDESFIEIEGLLGPRLFIYAKRAAPNGEDCETQAKASFHEDFLGVWLHKPATCDTDFLSCKLLGRSTMCLKPYWFHYPTGENVLNYNYEYVDSWYYGFQGRRSNCSTDHKELITLPRDESIQNLCYCHCLNSERNINLNQITSDIDKNYVIVGVRFQFINNTLTLQAAQGKLRSLLYITDFTWIPIEDVHKNSVQITSENRHIFLNKLKLNRLSAITGIGFELAVALDGIIGFGIKITGKYFDFQSGQLLSWAPNDFTDNCAIGDKNDFLLRRHFRPVNPIHTNHVNHTVSYRYNGPHRSVFPFMSPVVTYPHTFLTLTQSKMNDDFGQSTLPLFDSPSSTMPRAMKALNGIEMYHRASSYHSGFISLEHQQLDSLELDNYIGELEKTPIDTLTSSLH